MLLGCWLLAALLLPSVHVYSGISGYDEQRIVLVLLLAAAGLCFTSRLGYRRPPCPQPLSSLALVLTAFGVVSAAFSPVPYYAYLEVGVFLLIIAGICLISEQSGDEPVVRSLILPMLGGSVVFYGLVALLVLAAVWTKGEALAWPEPVHNFVNRRFLNQWQSWMLPLLPALLYSAVPRCRPWLFQAFIILFFGLFWALLFHTAGRGTLYGLVGSSLIIALLFGRPGIKWVGIQVLAAALGLVLAALILDMNLPGASDGVGRQAHLMTADSPGRVMLWGASAELVRENPWLGIGPMQFAALLPSVAAHPHSFPIQIAVEWGLPAALLLGAAVFWGLFRWLAFARNRIRAAACPAWERFYILSLTGSILTAGGHSLVSGIVVMPISQLMLVLICGLALGWYRRYRATAVQTGNVLYHRLLQGLVFCAVFWLLLFVGHELTNYRNNLVQGFVAARHTALQPRFWHQGKLVHHLDNSSRVWTTGTARQRRQSEN